MDQSQFNLSRGRVTPPPDVDLMETGGTGGQTKGSELSSWGRCIEALKEKSDGG